MKAVPLVSYNESVMSALPAPTPKRFTKEEFYKLGELGFASERSELIHGEIIEMPAIGPEHADITNLLIALIAKRLPEGWLLRCDSPLDLGDSQPQPDIALVRGTREMYRHAHPKTADLIIEVAQSSRDYDLKTKSALYAQAGVQEYVVIDVASQKLFIHGDPSVAGYKKIVEPTSGEFVSLAVSSIRCSLSDLF